MKLYVFSSSRALNAFLLEQKDGFLPKAMTLGDFFSQIIYVPNQKKPTPLIKKIFLTQVLKDFNFSDSQKQHLFFEYNFLGFLETSSFLFDFFRELFASQVSLGEVALQDVYGEFEDHLRVIEKVYRAYIQKLNENGFCDFPNEWEIFWTYLQAFEEIEFFVDGFLSAYEWKILFEISSKIPSCLHISIDAFNLSHFECLDLELEPNYRYYLSLSQRKILQREPNELQTQFALTSCEFRSDQCAVVIQKINEWLQAGIDAQKIAVVIPNEDFLPFLQSSDEKRNFNFAMGCPSQEFLEKLESLRGFVFQGEVDLLLQRAREIASGFSFSIQKQVFNLCCDFLSSQDYLKLLCDEEIIELFLQEIRQIREEDIQGGKISVIGLLETRGMSFEKIIVVDFVQENIPVFSQNDMFLNTSVRQKLKMPTLKDRQNLQKHFYLELFKSSKEVQITFIHHQLSSLIQELGIEIKPQKNPYTLFAPSQIREYQEEKICEHISRDFVLSSSKLNCFKLCKRKFYFAYMKDFCEEEDTGQNTLIGTLIHNALCEAYQGGIQGAKERFETALQNHMGEQSLKLQMQLSLAKLEMQAFWDDQSICFADEILYLEKGFDFVWKGWKFKGRIDRVDRVGNVIRVIDYKFSETIKNASIQGAIYYLYLQTLFPNQRIEVCFYPLKSGKGEYLQIDQSLCEFDEIVQDLANEESFDKTSSLSVCRGCLYQVLCNR